MICTTAVSRLARGPSTNFAPARVGSKMSVTIWLGLAAGLVFSVDAQAQSAVSGHGDPSRPIELCEAFPWDEPVEQTFTVASVLRWRRGGQAPRPERNPALDGGHR